MKEKINMEVDTVSLDQEIANYEKELRQCYSNRESILRDLDSLDYDDKHYQRRKSDLEERLYKTYDKIDDVEANHVETKAKRRSILADKVSADNIYAIIAQFSRLQNAMSETEKREFYSQLIVAVEIFEGRKPAGQWLKSVEFKLPIIEHDMVLSLDKGTHVETVCLLINQNAQAKHHVNVGIDAEDYYKIKEGK